MSNKELVNPLETLYGKEYAEKVLAKIKDLSDNSNIPYTQKLTSVGVSFIQIKAQEMVDGQRDKTSLESLVTSSFGEAAIALYNRP